MKASGSKKSVSDREVYENAVSAILTPGTITFQFDKRYRFASLLIKKGTPLAVQPEAIVGKKIDYILPRYLTKKIKATVHRVIKLKKPQSFEYSLTVKRALKLFHVHLSPVLNPETGDVEYFTTIIDVTERKKAEKTLMECEEKFRMFTEFAYDWVYWVSKDCKTIYVSPSSERISGYSPKEFMNNPELIARIVHPDDKRSFEKHRKGYHFGKKFSRTAAEFELRIITKKGEVRWVSYACRPIFDKDGSYLGRRATIHDITERKKAEESLRESEEKLEAVLENSPEGFVLIDSKQKTMYVNKVLEKILGVSRKDLIGKHALNLLRKNLIEPKSFITLTLALAKALRGQPVESIECTILRKGVRAPFELSAFPIRFKGSLITVGMVRDITERKTAEDTLRASKEQFELFMDHLPASVFIKDQESRTLYANRYTKEFYGSVNLIDKTLEGILPDEIANRIMRDDQRALRNGSITVVESIPDSDGVEHIFETHKFSIKRGGEPPFLGGLAVDITERKKAEKELKESEERYRHLIEKAEDVIYTLAPDGTLTSLNPACKTITGWDPKEWIGKQFKGIIHPEDLRLSIDNFKRTMRGSSVPPYKLHFLTKKGGYKIGEVLASPLAKDGRIIGVFGIIRDVTERERAERIVKSYAKKLESEVAARTEELIYEKRKVEALSAVKDEFIMNISHELKTPLSVILGNLTLLKDMAPIGREKEWSSMLEMLNRNAVRLRNSIEQILELSRLGTDKMKKERVYFKEFFNDVYREYLPLAKMKGLEFKVDVEPAIVVGDKELLRLAVNNLLSNAIKFTNSGSVNVTLRTFDNTVSISVADTGIGISQADQKRLFERFFKADPSAPGTGIGLVVAGEIVEKHDGRINVKSEVGKGSTFEILLPRGTEEAQGVRQFPQTIKRYKRKR
jgi:PAS domain S-box-containing protein